MSILKEAILVPRQQVNYIPSKEGRFVAISPDAPDLIIQLPLVRSPEGIFVGIESGWRSGLLAVDREMYKLKGCRPTGGVHDYGPEGSQTLSLAEYEVDKILERRAAFLKEGVDYPLEPIGIWIYDHILHHGEPNAATIYKAKGDTRLDELLWWAQKDLPLSYLPVKSQEQISNLFTKIGIATGHALRVLHEHNFTWDTGISSASNAHDGNVIVFRSGEKAMVALVDFDNSTTYHPDSDEDQDPMSTTQEHELKILKESLGEPTVVSRPEVINYDYYYDPKGIIKRTVRRALPGLSVKESRFINHYLLDAIDKNSTGSLRSRVIEGFEQGYSGKNGVSQNIQWNELKNLRQHIQSLRDIIVKEAQQGIAQFSTKAEFIDVSRRHDVFRYYKFPVVIDLKDLSLPEEKQNKVRGIKNPEGQRKKELIDLCEQLLGTHQRHIEKFPDTGEDYFNYPKVSDETLNMQSQLKKKDIGGIVQLFVNGDLDSLAQKYKPRVIGSFMLALSQINGNEVSKALSALVITSDDTQLISILMRINELLELMPPGVREVHNDRDYIKEIVGDRTEAFNIEREVGYRAGIVLFGYGLVTRSLHEIFNHHLSEIISNEFTSQQEAALKAAMECPDRIDSIGGKESIIYHLKLGLTGVQVRNGKRENLALVLGDDEDLNQRISVDLQCLFASEDMDTITDEDLRQAMSFQVNRGWVSFRVADLLREKEYVHANSFFSRTFKNSELEANDLVDILKTAIDMSNGDLSQIDPTIKTLLENKTYEGQIEKDKTSELVMACMAFGIDLPQVSNSIFENEENQYVLMDFLPKDITVHRDHGIYRTYDDYPVNPIYRLMSEGIDVIPDKLKDFFRQHGNEEKVIKTLATGILKHLFQEGYYRYYFGGAFQDPTRFPKPGITFRDLYLIKWQAWRLVHPDIWAILRSVEPELVADFINSEIEEGKIRMEHCKDKEGEMAGWRDFSISECLPKDIYQKIAPLIGEN